jgi:polyisoprenoid-binding protein YceI
MSTTATTSEALPSTDLWAIDPAHSTVSFSVTHHAVATFRSGFKSINGAYDGDAGRLYGEVPVTGVTLAGMDRLKGHILTEDFFDAERFPTFSFASSSVVLRGDELAVEGELTLRGVTRPIVAAGSVHGPLLIRHGDGHTSERFGIDLTTTIDRREFGILFNSEVAEGVLNLGWNVKLEAALELVREVETP